MAEQIVHPYIDLGEADGDIRLPPKKYLELSLFKQLKKPPDLDKFPGALVIRRYRARDELFRQGEPGWTAFYILTLEDTLTVYRHLLESARTQGERLALQKKIDDVSEELAERRGAEEDEGGGGWRAATVSMATPRTPAGARTTVLRMANFSNQRLAPRKNREGNTVYIPFGLGDTASFDVGKAPLHEGDLFGEMSCLYRTPRSATVLADRDCLMVEMARSILDKIYKDAAYKARADAADFKRFELQLRKMPFFRDLAPEDFNEIARGVELVSFDPGELICDEHERSDSMYLIRLGLVRVMKNVSHLLSLADVNDWGAFGEALRRGSAGPASPHGRFWTLLPERARAVLQGAAGGKIGQADRMEVVYSINEVLGSRKTTDAPEFKPVLESEPFRAQLAGVPANRKEWADGHYRRVNRLLLETLYPGSVRQHSKHAGVETILAYASPGDYFGETGLMLGQPRSATCVAYSHPNQEGTVELVKVPSKTFWRLMKASAGIRDKVKQEVSARRKNMLTNLAKPVWEEANQVQFSEEFGRLGLIQGQKLMLIDLDRCTRCDECVRACVHTHDDGNSRLFLDGPRFGKFLVPTSCRSCLDPVCMIPCPVASIRRGENRQIVIEDWCIGCSACAESCPYGSIQMDDLGTVPESARGWRWAPAASPLARGDWHLPRFNDRKWPAGMTPFRWERDFQSALFAQTPANARAEPPAERLVNFRYEFELTRADLKPEGRYKFEVMALGAVVRLWVNGKELTLDDRVKRGRHEYTVPPAPRQPAKPAPGKPVAEPPAAPPPAHKLTDFLRRGRNVVAAQVKPPAKAGEILFQLRLDEVKKPKELPAEVEESVAQEVVEKLVKLRAVVCDLCSTLPGRKPACVQACPHDAAMRVDARYQFPTKY